MEIGKSDMGVSDMFLDFLGACVYIGIVFSVGQWTVKRLRQEERNRMADYLSFAAGFAEMTILSTFLYFTCRLSVQSIRIVWVLLGSAALFSLMKRRMVTRSGLTVLGCVMILWLFMLLPGLVKGDQYYVYRGNCTDQQTYVEETVALSMHPIGWYESRTEEQVGMISDVLWRGYRWAVRDRPSAGLIYAYIIF